MQIGIRELIPQKSTETSKKGFQVYLKSIDDSESVLEHNGVLVYGKKTKNPANSENRHQNKQSLNSSSRKIKWDADVIITNE